MRATIGAKDSELETGTPTDNPVAPDDGLVDTLNFVEVNSCAMTKGAGMQVAVRVTSHVFCLARGAESCSCCVGRGT